MENGRSPALSSVPSEPEGPELMEGATAAVGRKQSLYRCYLFVFAKKTNCLLLLFHSWMFGVSNAK